MSQASRHLGWLLPVVAAGILLASTTSADAPTASASPSARAPAALDTRPAQRALEAFAREVGAKGGTLGAMAVDVESGRVLFAENEHRPLNPASNAKLWTAAGALHYLGAEHRFLTGLYGKVKGREVATLVLRGGGDPGLSVADLDRMARRLVVLGVERVGDIGVDQSHFDDRHVPPAFEQQPAEWAAFRAPVAALSLERNTLTFTVVPQASGKSARVAVEPVGFAILEGKVSTGDSGASEVVRLDMAPTDDGKLVVKLGGTVPEGSRTADYTRRVDDPTHYAGYALKELLTRAGIAVTGSVIEKDAPSSDLLVAHRSAPVGALLAPVGKDSDNFTAEMLLKAIGGLETEGAGTSEAGAKALERLLDQLGARGGASIVNGSGLFDANRATASGLCSLLTAMWRDPRHRAEYVSHLAVAGVDGTLKGRLGRWRTSRAIRAKTGTLRDVVALSGYVLRPDGGAVAFSFIASGVAGRLGPSRAGIDDVVDALTEVARAQASDNRSAQP